MGFELLAERLGGLMETQLEHLEGAALEAVRAKRKATQGPCVIKLGVDVHSAQSVVVAQWDHATPRAAQRFFCRRRLCLGWRGCRGRGTRCMSWMRRELSLVLRTRL